VQPAQLALQALRALRALLAAAPAARRVPAPASPTGSGSARPIASA